MILHPQGGSQRYRRFRVPKPPSSETKSFKGKWTRILVHTLPTFFPFCITPCIVRTLSLSPPTHPHASSPICPFILPLRLGLGVGFFIGLGALADHWVTQELPPLISITETKIKTVTHTIPPLTQIEIHTETATVTVPPAAHTRVAAQPAPEEHIRKGATVSGGRPTTAVEIVKEDISLPTPEIVSEEVEEVEEMVGDLENLGGNERTVTVVQRPRQTRRPTRWFGGKW